MDELLKILDGNADDVKPALAGKSHDDLLKLSAAEKDGKNRKGVLEAIEAALSAADAKRAGGVVQMEATNGTTRPPAIAADLDTSGPADIAPATTVDTAGAPQQIVPDVDLSHPAVDADPRAGTTVDQNRIDFNDPTKPGHEVVADALKASGNG